MQEHLISNPGWQREQSRRAAERYALLADLQAVHPRPARPPGLVHRCRHLLATRLMATARLIDVS
jgi:hypothetical protein